MQHDAKSSLLTQGSGCTRQVEDWKTTALALNSREFLRLNHRHLTSGKWSFWVWTIIWSPSYWRMPVIKKNSFLRIAMAKQLLQTQLSHCLVPIYCASCTFWLERKRYDQQKLNLPFRPLIAWLCTEDSCVSIPWKDRAGTALTRITLCLFKYRDHCISFPSGQRLFVYSPSPPTPLRWRKMRFWMILW